MIETALSGSSRLCRLCIVCRLGAVAATDLLTFRRQRLASLFPIEGVRSINRTRADQMSRYINALERHLVRPL